MQGRDDERDAGDGEFQLAINPAHPDAPMSEVDLRLLLERAGDATGAEVAYRPGAGYGDLDAVVLLERLTQRSGGS
ncbi:MAG: hypothetical protein ACRDOU_29525 [Streptosporangiaceae bacterium]